jgi:hypothetical protein
VSSKQFSVVAIDHQCQLCPVILATQNPAQVHDPSVIRCRSNRWQGLNPRAESNRPFSNLPAHDLEHSLDCVLIHVQQMRHSAVSFGSIIASSCSVWQHCPISATPEWEVKFSLSDCLISNFGMFVWVNDADASLSQQFNALYLIYDK